MTQQSQTNQADPQQPQKPKQPSYFATPDGMFLASALLMLASMIVALVATIALSKAEFADPTAELSAKYGVYFFSILLGMASVFALIAGAVRCGVYGRATRGVPQTDDGPTNTDILTQLQIISDRLLLSDTAKRIAYRQEDVNALREAIRDDIAKKDFDAAMVLVQEMSQTFGYREEAEEFREQIMAARSHEIDARVNVLLQRLDQIIAAHDFRQAMADALKIKRLYPDHPRVAKLDEYVRQAQEAYKHQLEREFLNAAQKDDVDRAMELLKQLDVYLTEREAEPFREVARGVIGKKRDNLGVQFKMAVHDKEWVKAIRVGEQIIRDFPNTRMAEEVRERIDLLRERAAGQQAAQQPS
ncbi:MAG: hypothetical protein Kow00105_04140 [Phycisphaeraceae bacterium]